MCVAQPNLKNPRWLSLTALSHFHSQTSVPHPMSNLHSSSPLTYKDSHSTHHLHSSHQSPSLLHFSRTQLHLNVSFSTSNNVTQRLYSSSLRVWWLAMSMTFLFVDGDNPTLSLIVPLRPSAFLLEVFKSNPIKTTKSI